MIEAKYTGNAVDAHGGILVVGKMGEEEFVGRIHGKKLTCSAMMGMAYSSSLYI